MLIEAHRRDSYRWWWIPVSILLALSLVVVPLPEPFATWRPDWVALVLIYWCMNVPERVGVAIAWLCGLCLDVMQFTLLGEQALSLAIVAFIVTRYHDEFLKMSPFQQTLCVFALLLFDCVFVAFIQSFVYETGFSWKTCAPAISAIVLWPFASLAVRNIKKGPEMF